MAYKKGDVVLVPFPFTDLSKTKVRPAVVVSTPGYEQATGSIIIAMLTACRSHSCETWGLVARGRRQGDEALGRPADAALPSVYDH